MEIDRDNRQALLVVCDGMGGAQSGDVASNLAVEVFSSRVLGELKPGVSAREATSLLRKAADEANQAVCEYALQHRECLGMGTTLVAALVLENTVLAANVGDSRCYHIGREGARRITTDHSVVEEMVLRGQITPAQARTHPDKNLITRAIGTEERVECDIFPVTLEKGEYLLLCSDGLSNLVSAQEMLFELFYGPQPDDCCARLMKMAYDRGAPDNVTVLIFEK